MNPNLQHNEEELNRLKLLKFHEEQAISNGFKIVAGVDEAGRGPLAGPVVCAACIIPPKVFIPGINDSKLLSPQQRFTLYEQITTHPNIVYAVGIVDVEQIDRVNILQATIQGMIEAVNNLKKKPDYLLVDGLKLPHPSIPGEKIIKGDALSSLIAAASIIAKETRDRIMQKYDEVWPEYKFSKHKGYGTEAHFEAIHKYGPCPIHRKSFEPIKSLIQ